VEPFCCVSRNLQKRHEAAAFSAAFFGPQQRVPAFVLVGVLLQGQVTSLTAELQEARGAAAQTPDRCRTAAKALQEQADRSEPATVPTCSMSMCMPRPQVLPCAASCYTQMQTFRL
jgi:hypothetical protein